MNQKKLLMILLIAASLFSTSCPVPGRGKTTDQPLPTNMKSTLVPKGGITFPMGTRDDRTGEIEKPFTLGETEVTNKLAAEILQWAYDHDRFSNNAGDHNFIDSQAARYGKQILMDFNITDSHVRFSGGSFSVDPGYENHPFLWVTWFGAVMICNWLTEREDVTTENLVYTVNTTEGEYWYDDDTIIDVNKTGYRLPTTVEWEYAARFLGSKKPRKGDLAKEFVFETTRFYGPVPITPGYYWSPGDYASGAMADRNNETANAAVAVYQGSASGRCLTEAAKIAVKKPNTLGLYDMSGNVWEWSQSENGVLRIVRGLCWSCDAEYLHVGFFDDFPLYYRNNNVGFRLCRTLKD